MMCSLASSTNMTWSRDVISFWHPTGLPRTRECSEVRHLDRLARRPGPALIEKTPKGALAVAFMVGRGLSVARCLVTRRVSVCEVGHTSPLA